MTLYLTTILVALGAGFLLACAMPVRPAGPVACGEVTPIDVFFSPGVECTKAAVGVIDGAARELRIDAYGFTNPDVIEALKRARRRGVDVRLVLDKSDESKPEGADVAEAGISVVFDRREPIHHVKAIMADGFVTFAGSWNITKQAARNDEACNVIRSREVTGKYLDNWNKHAAHSGKE